VKLVDRDQKPVTLMALAGGKRSDPRFFTFPDGSAGVLLEQTGEFFKLSETHTDATVSPVARDGFIDSGGVRIHYTEQGRGPAVVLVHELDGGIRTWMSSGVFQALARDHRVIALDARGHGLSDKPHDPARYGPEMAADIAHVMDRLSIPRAHIVGYSMGAEILTMLLVGDPARVASATLVAGAGRFRWKPTDEQHMGEEALEFAKFFVSPKLYLEQTPEGTPDPTDAELRALAATALADPGRDVEALAAFSRARRSRVMAPADVAGIRVPTLGIAGSTDPDLAELRELKSLRPDITVTSVDGATHAGPGNILGKPEFVSALQAFLKTQEGRATPARPNGR
jgi:pimeloyl-ACP methyl ester carboxylesterase